MDQANIFIVDDDRSLCRALARLVSSAGWNVETFADPLEFLQRERSGGRECLVLDVSMPKMGGVELRRQLRSERRGLPTIFITAFPIRDLEKLREADDVIDILYKPFDADSLLKAISRALV